MGQDLGRICKTRFEVMWSELRGEVCLLGT